MSAFIRREAVRVCPIHMMIRGHVEMLLEKFGTFEKDGVIEDLKLKTVADSIRWDYIREFIQEDQGCELVPLAASYFKQHKRQAEFLNTSRFIAFGHGKKTAGYASCRPENDHLVIQHLKIRQKLKNGVAKAFDAYLEAASDRLHRPALEPPDPPAALEPPAPPAGDEAA